MNSTQGITLGGFLLLALLFGYESYAQAQNGDFPWTAYFGTHCNQTEWAYSIRGAARKHTGMALIKAKMPLLDSAVTSVKALTKSHDVIIPVGGLGSGRDPARVAEFMDLIKHDVASWKNIVKTQASRFASLPDSANRIYWQLGNEINNKKMNESLRAWAGKRLRQKSNDIFVIPYYVEYLLAPTVESIQRVSRDVYGRVDKVQVLLGSMGNAGCRGCCENKKLDWLEELLEYEVRGTFASTLAGKKVKDLVDVVTIHYLVTANKNDEWSKNLDELRKKWIGNGKIRGIWATEELGKRRAKSGRGAATAIKVASRYLHWWGKHLMTPTQGRCFLWGWQIGKKPGTKGDDAMKALYQFLGDVPLKELVKRVTASPRNTLECYGFEDTAGKNKRVILAFPETSKNSVPVELFFMDGQGWKGDIRATMHVFSPKGYTTLPLTTYRAGVHYTFTPPKGFSFEPESAGMIFVQRIN